MSSAKQEVSASVVAQKIATSKRGAETATLTTQHGPAASAHSDATSQGTDVFATVDLGAAKPGFGIQEEAKPGGPKLGGCVIV